MINRRAASTAFLALLAALLSQPAAAQQADETALMEESITESGDLTTRQFIEAFLAAGYLGAEDPGSKLKEYLQDGQMRRHYHGKNIVGVDGCQGKGTSSTHESTVIFTRAQTELGKTVLALIDARPNRSLKYLVVLEEGQQNAFVHDSTGSFDENHLRQKLQMMLAESGNEPTE